MGSETGAGIRLDRAAIEKRIPHRDPFLFVSRVLEITSTGCVSEWDVAEDAFFFDGHYPGNPIVPGVILNEFVFQSAAIYMSEPDASGSPPTGVPVLTKIEDARFKKIIRPGDTVRAEVSLTERVGPACYMKAKVTIDGKTVLRLNFVVAMAAAEPQA